MPCLCLAGSTGERTAVAMHAIADAVTQCKFEATDPAADEVVLYKILQVAACHSAGVVCKSLQSKCCMPHKCHEWLCTSTSMLHLSFGIASCALKLMVADSANMVSHVHIQCIACPCDQRPKLCTHTTSMLDTNSFLYATSLCKGSHRQQTDRYCKCVQQTMCTAGAPLQQQALTAYLSTVRHC